MNKKQMITSGQLFTLIFISRLSLMIIYSSVNSGIDSLSEFISPLIISLPIMLLMLIPIVKLHSTENNSEFINTVMFQGGKALSFCYGAYFFLSAVYGAASIFDFMGDVLPEGIDQRMILSFLVIGCVYAAIKGIEAVSRMALIVLMLFILVSLLSAVYLFPLYSSVKLNTVQNLLSFSVADCLVFLTSRMNAAAVIGVFSDNVRNRIKNGLIICLFLGSAFMLLTAVLISGSAGNYLLNKDFQIFRSIDASPVLQRLDPIYILTAVCSTFCNITLFFIAASKCISFSFKKISEKKTVIISGAVLISAIMLYPEKKIPAFFYNKYLWAGAALLFVTVIPSVLLIKRKLRQKITIIKKRITRITAAGMMIILTIFLTGCSNLQLNNRIIVQGIGIDKLNDGYKLTVISLNTEDPKKENKSDIFYSEGKLINEAVDALEKQHGKKLLLNQCLFILMNEAASQDHADALSCFLENNDIPKSVDLITTSDTSEKTLNTAINEMGYNSEDIRAVCGTKALKNESEKITLLEYISIINKKGAVSFPKIITDMKINALRICGVFNA